MLYSKASNQNKLNDNFNNEDAISIEIKWAIERFKRIN